jgi:hypothetical protein
VDIEVLCATNEALRYLIRGVHQRRLSTMITVSIQTSVFQIANLRYLSRTHWAQTIVTPTGPRDHVRLNPLSYRKLD